MFKREALYAGKYALRKPTKAAITRAMPIVGRDTLKPNKMPVANGEWAITFVSKAAIATPSSPPATDNATASPTNNESTLVRVNPSVFSIATSRVRSRMDIAMVLAATKRIANTTAAQMLKINAGLSLVPRHCLFQIFRMEIERLVRRRHGVDGANGELGVHRKDGAF